jgi:drug/metabolite transporter (DMT)-like permease
MSPLTQQLPLGIIPGLMASGSFPLSGPSFSSGSLLGVVLSLITAAFWAVSPLFWASAGRRIGSFQVVLLRSILASVLLLLIFLPGYAVLIHGCPTVPTCSQVFWLTISGLTGLVIGDVLLYEAFVLLGARRTSQVLMLQPVSAVLLGWFWLGEVLSRRTLAGIAVVLAATSYAVLAGHRPWQEPSREPGRVSATGLFLAVLGALAVGVGSVTGRHAYEVPTRNLDPMVATVVRVVSATVLLWLIPLARGRVRRTVRYLRDPFVFSRVLPGTLAGPVLGMIGYLMSLRLLEAGVVSTLVAMSPLFILPIVALWYRVRIRPDVIAATAIACGGVAMICLHYGKSAPESSPPPGRSADMSQYQTVTTPSLLSSEWEMLISLSGPSRLANWAASSNRASQLVNLSWKISNCTRMAPRPSRFGQNRFRSVRLKTHSGVVSVSPKSSLYHGLRASLFGFLSTWISCAGM